MILNSSNWICSFVMVKSSLFGGHSDRIVDSLTSWFSFPVSYTHLLVNKIYKRILSTKNKTHQTNNTQPSKYITLTYYNSNTHKIANTFRKHNYKIAYRTNNTIKKHINFNKDTDTYSKTGVYKLNCNDCNQFYICLLYTSSQLFPQKAVSLENKKGKQL